MKIKSYQKRERKNGRKSKGVSMSLLNFAKGIFGSNEEEPSSNTATTTEVSSTTVAPLSPLDEYYQNDYSFEQANKYQKAEDAEVEPSTIPIFITKEKIHNTLFEAERTRRINAVFDAIRPYYDFMLGYDSIAGNVEICIFLKTLIKEFISQFWDMPSSLDHHHNSPYGQLVHCLGVAIINVERSNNNYHFTSHGIDAEKTFKDKPYVLLASFIVGLLHDANKIFHYHIKAKIQGVTIDYNPIRGSILNFTMAYPTDCIERTYRPQIDFDFSMISFFFHRFVPIEVQMAFPSMTYWTMVRDLRASHEETMYADSKSIESWTSDKKNISELKQFVFQYLFFSFPNLPFLESTPIFRLDSNWYGVSYWAFVGQLAKRYNISPDAMSRLLYGAGYLGGFEDKTKRVVCNFDLELYLDPKTEKSIKLSLCAVPASFLEPILLKLYQKMKLAKRVYFNSDDELETMPGIKQDEVYINIQYKEAFNSLFENKTLVSQHIYFEKLVKKDVNQHRVEKNQNDKPISVSSSKARHPLPTIATATSSNDDTTDISNTIAEEAHTSTKEDDTPTRNTEKLSPQVENPESIDTDNSEIITDDDKEIDALSYDLLTLFLTFAGEGNLALNMSQESVVFIKQNKQIVIRYCDIFKLLYSRLHKNKVSAVSEKPPAPMCIKTIKDWTRMGCINRTPSGKFYETTNVDFNLNPLTGKVNSAQTINNIPVAEFSVTPLYSTSLKDLARKFHTRIVKAHKEIYSNK